MCAVSNVSGWGQERWPYQPERQKPWDNQTLPKPLSDGPTRKEWEEFKEMIRKAIEIDKYTGTPDCVDPKKDLWMKKMSEQYDEIYGNEKKL